jgi:hypothetical protein
MSAVSIKYSDLIRQYDGSGDFLEWVKKLELVARLQKVENLEQFIPLFLSGGAFAVYQSLSEETQMDYEAMKKELTSAFSLNQFKAYEEFMNRRLGVGEPVDVYLADLSRLGTLVSSDVNEEWLKCAFVCGLPDDMKKQLLGVCTLTQMTLHDVVEKARGLANGKDSCFVSLGRKSQQTTPFNGRERKLTCFSCGVEGHISRECANRGGERNVRLCFICNNPGHLAVKCPLRKEAASSKNE